MKLNKDQIEFLVFGDIADGFDPRKYKIIERSPWMVYPGHEEQYVIFQYNEKYWKFIYTRICEIMTDADGEQYWDYYLNSFNGVILPSFEPIPESDAHEVERILSPEIVVRWLPTDC